MFLLLLNYVMIVFFNISNACAQTIPAQEININDPQSIARFHMQQYDFDQNGKVAEKEFFISDGDSGYREHLSNIYKSLNIAQHDNITEQQYWFIELTDSAKYQADLAAYFDYMDKDGDDYISINEYQNTFKSTLLSNLKAKYAQAIDKNSDNRISRDEYINFDFTSLPSGSHSVFHNIDTNNDGAITVDEFKNIFAGGKI